MQRKFEEDNVPVFIRDYFSFINSEAGKLNYWGTVKKFLMWCIERNDIRKDSISDITPDGLDGIKTVSVIVFLEDLIKNGIFPSTMKVKKIYWVVYGKKRSLLFILHISNNELLKYWRMI